MTQATWVPLPAPYEQWLMPEDMDLHGPGVYYWRNGKRSYVGATGDLWERLSDHRRAGALFFGPRGNLYPTTDVAAANRLEAALIWLLHPTENQSRLVPPVAIWAGTLGHERPIHDWSWRPGCGHVKVKRRWLVTAEDASNAECSCRPMRWERTIMAYVDRLQKDRADSETRRYELLGDYISLRSETDSLREHNGRLIPEVERLEEEIERLEEEVEQLEYQQLPIPTEDAAIGVVLDTLETFGGTEDIIKARRVAESTAQAFVRAGYLKIQG